MFNFFNRHSWIIGIAVALLIVLLPIILKSAGLRPNDAAIGYTWVVIGGGVILSALAQSRAASQAVPLWLTAAQGTIMLLAGLDWIVTPNGSSHIVGTAILLLGMAGQMYCHMRKPAG